MTTRKYTSNWETFYEVSFLGEENKNIADCKSTTHIASVYFDGSLYYCILIDGKQAESLAYKTLKAAVKNARILE